MRRYFVLLLCLISAIGQAATVSLIPTGATWRYLDNGSNQGTSWRGVTFAETGWKTGAAQLGYGDGGEATVVSYGPNSNSKYVTTYFRRTFVVGSPSAYNNVTLRLLRDDGAVIYLNGSEVWRHNMPSGTVSYTTLASSAIGGADESTFYQTTLSPTLLRTGTNVLAVEIHQANVTSTDLSFDLELLASTSAGGDPTVVTRGPYLQLATPTSIVLRWRTDRNAASHVRFGPAPGTWTGNASSATLTNEHVVQIAGLQPDMRYYYEIGTQAGWFTGDAGDYFATASPAGTARPTRVWVLGDSGTANANAANVRNGYVSFAGARSADLWLMLGDNAYNSGTDSEYQNAVFNMYPTILQNTVLWPAIGNHDTAGSANPPTTLPYLNMFTLPRNGEAGGIASGTEKYYSFDYANIHFICLDSMSSDRSTNGAMLNWLRNDLAATTQDWIVAFWHHPPYTRGSHNSDTASELVQMRANALPILEDAGVDIVLTGHSHSYERSYLLDGHYGLSSTLNSAMVKDGGDGRESGSGAYRKEAGATRAGAVYTVAGSGGQISGGSLNHPAMFSSLNLLGSVVLDVDGLRLDATFIGTNAAVLDSYTIIKAPPAPIFPAAPTVLLANAESSTQIGLSWRDNSTNEDGFRIERSTDGVNFSLRATLGVNVTGGLDTGLAPGTTYFYRVQAFNTGGNSLFSNTNSATTPPLSPPPAPDSLTATPTNGRVDLVWGASSGATSYNLKRGTTSGGPYGLVVSLGGTSHSDSSVENGVTYYYAVTANGSGGESNPSPEESARPEAPPEAPTTLTAGAASTTQIDLSWTDNSTNEAWFRILRAATGGAFGQIGLVYSNEVTFSDTGLTPDSSYDYQVIAMNVGGDSAPATASARTLAPVSPASLLARAFDSRVELSWPSASGAGAYNVKRSLASGGPYSQIGTTPLLELTDSSVINGTQYFYVVRAVEEGVESANSPEASAIPNPPPVAPSGFGSVFATTNEIALAWVDNADNEDGFYLERSQGGASFASIGTLPANTSAYTDPGLPSGTAFSYRLRSYNAFGQSAWVSTATNTLVPPPPEGPGNLAATAVSTTQIDLTWVDRSTDETGFSVERGTDGQTFSQIHTTDANATSYSDKGLAFDTAYFYRVRAFSAHGQSVPAEQSTSTLFDPADTPGNFGAILGNGSVALSWSASQAARRYTLRRSINGGVATIIAQDITATSYLDSSIGNGATYTYSVASLNSGGESAPAVATIEVALPPPAGLVATAGIGYVSLEWGAVAGASSYNLKRSTNSTGPFATILSGSQSTAHMDTNVVAGIRYYYIATAQNGGGESAPSAQASATPNPAGLPAPWLSQDIGTVGAAGSSSYAPSSNSFTVIGSGADITAKADSFRYMYQNATGNCSIVVRVDAVQNTAPDAKAGIMIRETLLPNSKVAAICVTPASGIHFLRRSNTGGTLSPSTESGFRAPYWLRLERTGDTVIASRSSNGTTWTKVRSVTITMNANVFIGLAVTSKKQGTLCTSVFSNVTATP